MPASRTRARVARLPEVRRHLAAGWFAAAALAALTVAQLDLLARLIVAVIDGRAVAGLTAALAAATVARAALAGCREAVAGRTAARATAALRHRVLAAAQSLGPQWVAGRPTGELVALTDRGIDGLTPYLRDYLPQLALAAALPVAVLIRLCWADPASALVVAATLPLIPLFGALAGRQARSATRRQWRRLSVLSGHFLDTVLGLPTLRAFGRAGTHAVRLRTVADAHRHATMTALRVAFLTSLVLELVAALSLALLAVPIGLRLLAGDLDLRTALVVLLLAPEAYLPLRALGARFHAGAAGLAAAEDAFAVLDAAAPTVAPDRPDAGAAVPRPRPASTGPAGRPDAADVPAPRPAPTGRAARRRRVLVRCEDVTVRYPGRDEPALCGFDLTVEAGDRLVLTGPSGSGKSTVLALVLGFVRPARGRVLLDGLDLDSAGRAELAAWRARLGWLPQRPRLFAGTLAANVALGAPDVPEARIRRAIRAAALDEVVTGLPAGLHTVLGENGHGLSAGQRQRVALARALCRDAPLLLLDEPTARLDADTEAAVLAAATRLPADRTLLAVAHRPATIAAARPVPMPPVAELVEPRP
ncbi:thiol reductant ABC exporter subunit CydD [Actinocatenispora thailandica]|uniref:Thiol reductant ABC exporter subunit CydD n=1 Tax=Actinocatenispora thailandica TaxID=227318 RepID=A0A7R7DMR7_9ACTN|nr:thiol reductant ABC exporter subunit CydD [Actinocatenispora thailandica]BCJ34599.1 thiol reductant ABC exporter subunit CydD [Actinocatenispora thailandica]